MTCHMDAAKHQATPLSTNLLQILQHTLGADRHGRAERHASRNHFVAGGIDVDRCERLCELGLMSRGRKDALTGGSQCYHATDAGRKAMREASPPAPQLTPSQRRYREFLDADSGMKFIDWLRHSSPRKASVDIEQWTS